MYLFSIVNLIFDSIEMVMYNYLISLYFKKWSADMPTTKTERIMCNNNWQATSPNILGSKASVILRLKDVSIKLSVSIGERLRTP